MQSSVEHYRRFKGMGIGPGGIGCPCCMPYQDKKQLRRIARKRITRQVFKLAMDQLRAEDYC
jgi:hypothetical protein